MSRNNTFYSKPFVATSIINDPTELWDFLEETFDEFDIVSFEQDTENNIMYIYLDETKKLYIKVMVDGNIRIDYGFGETLCNYSCTYTSSTVYFTYFRTKWGITFGSTSIASNATSVETLQNFFVSNPVPTLICGLNLSTSSNIYYLATPLHEEFESMNENAMYLASSFGGQKFVVTNAYSCSENIDCQHLFRVLCIPQSTYPKGKIKVGDKYLYWSGRYALEYDPNDTTGV